MTEPTMTELKARAYDLIAFKEQAQRELDAVNAQIGELFRQEQEANRVGNADDWPAPEATIRPLDGGVKTLEGDGRGSLAKTLEGDGGGSLSVPVNEVEIT